jgi:hypothetical protein
VRQPLLIDLFAGRLGWSKGFLVRGWKVRAYDLRLPDMEIPEGVEYILRDIMTLTAEDLRDADFVTCSSPCEEFSVHCMKHFHPNPKPPVMGIKLFEHSRAICEASGKPYVMENVRCAEQFVGRSVTHCGPFYLWGNAIPAVMPAELYKVQKGCNMGHFGANDQSMRTMTREQIREERRKSAYLWTSSKSKARKDITAKIAEIPHGLSDYLASTVTI